ncbi:hypothetical protein ACFSQ0_03110 [Mesonia sediminis]|uniref:Uncharacterized protein n=1 Tax=Mesonia sediminis TaxID=1703946 RepID=A0ABW5SBT4_9FLAO
MQNFFLQILCFFLPIITLAQVKEINLFDGNDAINEFQLFLYYKDSTEVLYNNNSNKLIIHKSQKKNLDSLFIHYDGFYSQKLELSELEKDSIILDKSLHLEEVIIKKKLNYEILGIRKEKRKINGFGGGTVSGKLIQLNAEEYVNAKVKNINLYIKKGFTGFYGNKHRSQNKNIQFLIFQSNSKNPNDSIINLLPNKLIVNTKSIKNDWLKVDLDNENIILKNYKYLYIGFINLQGSLEYGVVYNRKLENPPAYFENSYYEINKKWLPINYIEKYKKLESVPAIYIETVK